MTSNLFKWITTQCLASDKLTEIQDELFQHYINQIELKYNVIYEATAKQYMSNYKVQQRRLNAVNSQETKEITQLRKNFREFRDLSRLFTEKFNLEQVNEAKKYLSLYIDKNIIVVEK